MKKKLSNLTKSNPKALFLKSQKLDEDVVPMAIGGDAASKVGGTSDQ